MVKFAAFAATRNLGAKDVRRGDVVDFLGTLYRKGLDSRSVARHLVTISHFFRFALMESYVQARVPEPGRGCQAAPAAGRDGRCRSARSGDDRADVFVRAAGIGTLLAARIRPASRSRVSAVHW